MHGTGSFRPSRRIFIGGLIATGAPLSLPAAAPGLPGRVTPEQFGAVGDGHRDDARAFAAALAEAGRTAAPLVLAPNAHYALGSRGWPGLAAPPGSKLVIEGNGANLHLRALPSQPLAVGAGHPLLRFIGGTASVLNVNFDLGGLAVAAIEAFGSRVTVERSRFTNGAGDNLSFGLYLNRCSGFISGNSAERIGHFIYAGHTDLDQHSWGLEIAGNHAVGLGGDFVVGVMKDSVIRDNLADGMFSGVALAGFDRAGSRSENIMITGNSFTNFKAHGVQSDVVGDIRLRNVVIRNNALRRGIGAISAGIYLIRVDGFEAQDNTVEGTAYGVVLDAVANGNVSGNKLNGSGAARNGIMLAGDVGRVEDVMITGNEVAGYDIGLASGGSDKGGVQRVRIERNAFRDGGQGIQIIEPAAAIYVAANAMSGNRRGNLTAHAAGVRVDGN